ncbi:hypothetical protein E4V42_03725 [Clostridium estertheticum]|uniref:HNH endonuclease n=1 Tax=Clostridium estertheticum TaxID=238834 RepID=A0A5N7IJS3_9CLOT|nr:hypothetical protein [Clostridium estertheticum]MPQ30546.1 hypothetical protein [Clostridium estertheticum]MPQ61222.1 hypothetical protein [Clostridium estertheticum]
MGYCIYYKKSEPDVHFTKREHVIPAGLGGISKLPLGYVSDEANEYFSPLEMEILRDSLLAVNRNNVGPGKRGSLNVKKVKAPTMRVMKKEDSSGENYNIGFVFVGESYIISQIAVDFNDKENSCIPSYRSTVFDIQQGKQTLLDFRKNLIGFFSNTNRKFKLIDMPYTTDSHFINVGYFKGKWFAATSHKIINMDYLALILLPALKEEQLKDNEPVLEPKAFLKYTYKFDINTSLFFFIYVKTAFNALAFLKGSDFASKEMFDNIRKSILIHDNSISDFIVNEYNINNELKDIAIRIPEKAHFVIITSRFNSVIAYVSFYKERPALVKLTDNYEGEVFTEAIVCDWKNRNEFTLDEIPN